MVKCFASDALPAEERPMPVYSTGLCRAALVPGHRRRSRPQRRGDCWRAGTGPGQKEHRPCNQGLQLPVLVFLSPRWVHGRAVSP